jgi:hypothetical protein
MLKEAFSSKYQEQNMIADLIIIQEKAEIKHVTLSMKMHFLILVMMKKS